MFPSQTIFKPRDCAIEQRSGSVGPAKLDVSPGQAIDFPESIWVVGAVDSPVESKNVFLKRGQSRILSMRFEDGCATPQTEHKFRVVLSPVLGFQLFLHLCEDFHGFLERPELRQSLSYRHIRI